MYVQWCLKGVTGIDDHDVAHILFGGLSSNWFRKKGSISVHEIPARLTPDELDWHVNRYKRTYPPTGRAYGDLTPFISLTAGAVERRVFLATNVVHPATRTAREFATRNGTVDGYVFRCWVTVGLNPAVGIESVAEEVRELNTSRPYSAYQLQGEVAAKIHVPSTQIESCAKYEPAGGGATRRVNVWTNPRFIAPDPVLNLRQEI